MVQNKVWDNPVLTTASKARELMGGAEGEAGITPPTGGRPPPTPDSVQLKGWKNGTQCCTSETRPQFSKTDLSQWNHSLQTMDFFQRGHLSCRWAPTPDHLLLCKLKSMSYLWFKLCQNILWSPWIKTTHFQGSRFPAWPPGYVCAFTCNALESFCTHFNLYWWWDGQSRGRAMEMSIIARQFLE